MSIGKRSRTAEAGGIGLKRSLIVAAVFFIIGLFFRFALIGYTVMALIFCGLALLVLVYALLKKRRMLRTRKVLTALLCIGLAAFIALEIPIIKNARTDKDTAADYLIVLGAGVNGTVPSLSLTDRLTAALDYMEMHPECLAIVSGGQGPGEDVTEAEAMRRWLEARGVAAERILMEDRATSTEENVAYSMEIIRQRGNESASIAIVSSEYHLYRAKCIARAQGIAQPMGIAGRTSYPVLMLNYCIREAFAVVYMWVFD